MANWVRDLLWGIFFLVVMTGLLAGLQVIVSFMYRGSRAILGFERDTNRYLAGTACVILGAVLGGLSLGIRPRPMPSGPLPPLLVLLIIPTAVGLLTRAWGRYRRRRMNVSSQLDAFVYGFLFSLTFGLVRFLSLTPNW